MSAEDANNVMWCCDDWPIQITKINGPIQLQAIRSGFKYQYDGIPFRFCPWCGKKRTVEIAETETPA